MTNDNGAPPGDCKIPGHVGGWPACKTCEDVRVAEVTGVQMAQRTNELLARSAVTLETTGTVAAAKVAARVASFCTNCGSTGHLAAGCIHPTHDTNGNAIPALDACGQCGSRVRDGKCRTCTPGTPQPEGKRPRFVMPPFEEADPEGYAASIGRANGTKTAEPQHPTGGATTEPVAEGKKLVITPLPNLPDKFWESREILRRIRRAARYAQTGPDIVLLAVLCRLSGMASHRLTFNFGMGQGSLSLFGGAVGGTGLGKTLANHAAQDLLLVPTYLARDGRADPRKFKDSIGVGTGEGLIEAFMGFVVEETGEIHTKATKNAKVGDPVTERVRRQVRHNAYFFLDEGETLAKLMERSGQTIGPTIRSAWAGTSLGQELADSDRTRWIDRLSYAVGMVIGFQPETVQSLLADGAAGTPQRFLWMSGYDLELPDEEFEEVPPLRIPIEEPDGTPLVGTITGPEWLRKELKARRAALLRAEIAVQQMDSHEVLMKCKVASLLALLDGGRTRVLDDDWELALMVWDTSAAIRDQLTEVGRKAAADGARRKNDAAAETAAAKHVAIREVDAGVETAARWLAKRIHDAGPDTERGPRRFLEGKLRKHYDLALDRAVQAGWVIQEDGHLRPGTVRPV